MADKALIIDAHSRGVPWEEIGASLSPRRSSEAVQLAARRMRRRGEWPVVRDAVREMPSGPGRPRNRVRTRAVSPRFAPEVAATLRAVAAAADMRLGAVVEEALARAVARHDGRKVSRAPLGLDPGGKVRIAGGSRSETVSVCVDAETFAALRKITPDVTASAAVHDACARLLQDLHYVIALVA